MIFNDSRISNDICCRESLYYILNKIIRLRMDPSQWLKILEKIALLKRNILVVPNVRKENVQRISQT